MTTPVPPPALVPLPPTASPAVEPVGAREQATIPPAPVAEPATAASLVNRAAAFAPEVRAAQLRLENALARVDPEQLKRDLSHIASDEMQGRDTPSEGLSKTEAYIQDRLVKEGWQPAGAPNSFLYPYDLWRWPVDNHKSSLTFSFGGKDVNLRHGQDYFYSSMARPQSLSEAADVVFVGTGSEAEFAWANVKDKWALCLDDEANREVCRVRAKKFGARGVIVVPKDDSTDLLYQRRLEHHMHLAREGRLDYPPQCLTDEIILAPGIATRLFADIQTQFSMPQAFPPLILNETRALTGDQAMVQANNVVALWPGSDPARAKEVFIISAHVDHLGIRSGQVFNGADDNASGSVALLALTEAIKELNPGRSVMLIWFSGEEKGLLGSGAWVKNPYLPDGLKPVEALNLDMIGRNAAEELHYTPSSDHPKYNEVSRTAEETAGEEGFKLIPANNLIDRSDQASLMKLVQALLLTTNIHKHYHHPSDDAERINYEKLARVVRLAVRIVAART